MAGRKPIRARMPLACARRQGDLTRLAFLLLGRETAISFLNGGHVGLGRRLLDLATAGIAGRDAVEAELNRMASAGLDRPRDTAAHIGSPAGTGAAS